MMCSHPQLHSSSACVVSVHAGSWQDADWTAAGPNGFVVAVVAALKQQ